LQLLREEDEMKGLRKFRTMLGLSQYELGKKAGIERSRISLLENGQIVASEKEKAALERALLAARRKNEAQFARLGGSGSEVHA
jgi:transcriptional regulator with XRE-family HTH domain